MKLFVCALVLSAVAAAVGELGAQIYCGRRLAQALAVLCEDNYLVKRGGPYGPMLYGPKPHAVLQYETRPFAPELYGRTLHGPELYKMELHALKLSTHMDYVDAAQVHAKPGLRRKRQIIAECCENACTIDQLMTYC